MTPRLLLFNDVFQFLSRISPAFKTHFNFFQLRANETTSIDNDIDKILKINNIYNFKHVVKEMSENHIE